MRAVSSVLRSEYSTSILILPLPSPCSNALSNSKFSSFSSAPASSAIFARLPIKRYSRLISVFRNLFSYVKSESSRNTFRSFVGVSSPYSFLLIALYHYINCMRCLVMYGTVPGPNTWIACIGSAVVMMGVGLAAFRKLQRNFILYL